MNAISTQFPELPTPAAVLERTWRATWFVGESKLDHCIEKHAVYAADQMHQYARDYAAALSQTAGVAERRTFTDAEIREWMERHDLESMGMIDARAAVEDAQSMDMLAAAPAEGAEGKTYDRCTDPENCKRCSEDASTPHAGIPHAAPAASGGEGGSPLCRKHGHIYAVGCADCDADIDMLTRAEPPAAASAGSDRPAALQDGTLSKSTVKRVTALAAASESYAKANPLGGPATMFDAIANRLRAGEPMAEVLEDYGLRFVGTAAASVSERARSASLKEIVPAEKRNYLDDNGNPRSIEDEAYAHGWNACRAATLRAIEQALTQQRGEVEDEDYHVIMSMGRLLAEIAVILKGAEPAGTAWSYHDLPELVKSAVENAHDIASEMRAWAAVKMRERGSSRRDKMMVEEWSKRLLALPEVAFPVKDFDIPGLSITKEEIRFAIRKVVADRVFIGQDFGGTTPQPSADAVREGIRSLLDRVRPGSEAAPWVVRELESLLGRGGK